MNPVPRQPAGAPGSIGGQWAKRSRTANDSVSLTSETHLATDQIAEIARLAHRDQTYRDMTYFDGHLEPISRLLAPMGQRAEQTGLLHDIVEDTDVTLEELRAAGVDPSVVDAVDALTKRPGESKQEAALRAREAGWLSRSTKLADNTVNRLGLDELARTEPERAERLRAKYTEVRELLIDGDPAFAELAESFERDYRGN